jgi:hypothetical protein
MLFGGAACLVAIVVVVGVPSDKNPAAMALRFFQVVAVGLVAASLALGARVAPALRSWHDAKEARHVLASLAGALLAGATAVLLFERAAIAMIDVGTLGRVGTELGPGQWTLVLLELASDKYRHIAGGLLEPPLVAAAGLSALARGVSRGRHPFALSIAGAVVVLAVVTGASVIGLAARMSDVAKLTFAS